MTTSHNPVHATNNPTAPDSEKNLPTRYAEMVDTANESGRLQKIRSTSER